MNETATYEQEILSITENDLAYAGIPTTDTAQERIHIAEPVTQAPKQAAEELYEREWSGLTARQRLYLPFKRMMDILLSLIGLIICAPLFLVIAIAIKLDSPGPVFYKRRCIGRDYRPFAMLKFRSMVSNADEIKESLQSLNEMDGPVFKIANDPRITKVGRIIRRFSIDELPQLANVFLGQMSLVGPRPLTVDETEQCTSEQRRRLGVTPGITCFWQISGRNTISFEQWIQMDLKYIQRISPVTDVKILIKTIPAVLCGHGAY